MKFSKKLSALAVASALSVPAVMVAAPAQAELSGNIGVVSQYVLRGIGQENDRAAIQGGIDYANDSGFYLGWWGSSLGYNYNAPGSDAYTAQGFENDIYGGFAGSVGGIDYNIGLLQYYYLNVDDSDLTELVLGAGYGPFSAQAQYLLNDGLWGNAGDTYWTFNYGTDLPSDFTLDVSLGYYTYNDDDAGNDKGGPDWIATTESSAFRHLNFTLSHPIGDTGADMGITYIIAGDNRGGVSTDDTMTMNISYGFGL
ncbi:hypothetical protein MNBD_GAMMA17-1177 [hydrothermal vent metagenome]|uniref:Uncharacterized protein n=1 Tax=hydrothermal vent metagenome TaxID=652676 RepID=A0A3B0ZPR2_9ZZZZ